MAKRENLQLRILVSHLKRYKEEHNLTYEEIGKAIGVDYTTAYKIFKMINAPSFEVLTLLAQYMEVPMYTLFLPTDDFLKEYYAELIQGGLAKNNIDSAQLAERTKINSLRMIDICRGATIPTQEELVRIFPELNLDLGQIYNDDTIKVMKSLLSNLGLDQEQREIVMQYILSIKK